MALYPPPAPVSGLEEGLLPAPRSPANEADWEAHLSWYLEPSRHIQASEVSLKSAAPGVLAGARRYRQHLCSVGTQARSLAPHSGLRIHCCRHCGLGSDCIWDLIPGPGTPHAMGWPKETNKTKCHS